MTTTLAMINLDGPDPRAQAGFYGALLGWDVVHAEDEYAMISGEGAPIGFGRVPGWTAPPWPDPEGTKRYHLDLTVDDLDAAHRPGARARRDAARRPAGGEVAGPARPRRPPVLSLPALATRA